jgi:hypothetical protein
LFADDCLLYRHVNSQNDSDLLQKYLSALEKWDEEWQMSFHPQKCTVIRIATNQRHVIPTQYTLHGHTLEVVDSAKYLGVTINEDLQWSKHIDNTVSKATSLWVSADECGSQTVDAYSSVGLAIVV